MLQVGTYLRGSWKDKPQQWGNFADVQAGLFHNLGGLGFDPDSIKLAVPGWEMAGLVAHNYAHTNTHGTLSNGAVFSSTGIECVTSTDHLDTNLQMLDLCRDDDDTITVSSTIFTYQNTLTPTNDYIYLISNYYNYAQYGLWLRISDGRMASYPGKIKESVFGEGFDTTLLDGTSHTVGLSWQFNSYPKLLIDNDVSLGDDLSDTLASNNNYNVTYGGRPDSATRYSCGIIGSIIAANVTWTNDQLQILSENIDRIWQPYSPPIYIDLGSSGSSAILPIDGNLPAMNGALTKQISYHRSIGGSI